MNVFDVQGSGTHMTESLLIERAGPRTTLTLNRPERINALHADLVEALLGALEAAATDGTRLVEFRGSGRGFSGGFDFSGLEEQSDGDLVLRFIRLEQLLQKVATAPYMTLALVHGPCFGAAADLVAACALRIGAPDTRFRMPGLRFGIALGTGRLARVVGTDAARALLTTSRVFDAEEARRIGFLTRLAERDAWPAVAEQATEESSVLSVDSLARMLELTRNSAAGDDAAALAALVTSLAKPGLKKRVTAYLAALEQRKPSGA